MKPVSRSMRGDIGATLARILAYMGGLGLLAMAVASLFRTEVGVAALGPAPRPEWVAVDRPHPAFEMQMPEWSSLESDYAILRRAADGGRRDLLGWGRPAASGPYVMVEIYRPGRGGEHFIDAPSEIAARILPFAVTDDVKPAGRLDSKFGPVALVDFAIAVPVKDSRHAKPRRCLGFTRPFDHPAIQIAGWYCSPGEEVVDRGLLACAIDRLTMLSAGGDDDVAALFARAEIRRSFCGQRSPILAATPEREQPVATPHNARSAHGVKLRGRLSLR